ncbi:MULTISPECIES: hypothetical protein [Pseudomonas]|jgi:hypothetical protein|uniref:Heme utilization protein n=1 Tax=Pseudomonas brassicacearum (strain NFM421) TaxID=994484 RepID=F2KC82_PSEBN|nr:MULTISPECIES: hypothetical protein [Pseudomonas]EIK58010.1 hypothetical protein PflQ8_4413 [Pseudomonas fluorescens Q8r1-96]KIR13642.1 hypothetical protein PFLU4_52530 [Pseudomonas fluorescens]AEA70735.1 Conserved hypothetical protein; putative exported protein [Pseudomonas brassicacearum subsp. brassicacearum NFM421]ALQ05229.1 Large exoproteins involved in heme utilization or adhesion [Pseudomonas brassicacearum]AOS41632.1 hypothetical protein A0U95_23510 [Pseudomonas brassicacearum]
MKSRLIFALALSVLATNTFAADGFDRTGSAAAIKGYDQTDSATIASDDHANTDPTAVASDGSDHTGSAHID